MGLNISNFNWTINWLKDFWILLGHVYSWPEMVNHDALLKISFILVIFLSYCQELLEHLGVWLVVIFINLQKSSEEFFEGWIWLLDQPLMIENSLVVDHDVILFEIDKKLDNYIEKCLPKLLDVLAGYLAIFGILVMGTFSTL